MKVEYFTTTDYAELSNKSTIRETLETFLEKRVDIACVIDGGELIGIVTKYSLYRLLLNHPSLDQPIYPAIKRNIITIQKDMTLYEAKDIMIDGKVSHAVVLTKTNQVFGIMSKSDLIRGIMSEVQNLADRMKSLLEHLQDAVISVDTSLRITTFNRAAKQLFQFDHSTIGKSIHTVLPTFTNELVHSLATGETIEAKRISLPKSKVIASFVPIWQLSQITGVMIVLKDVTSFESIASELESTKRLKKILDSAIEFAYDGVVITDHAGNITMVNEGFLDLYGFQSNKQIIGKKISKIAPEIPFHKSLDEKKAVKGEVIKIKGKPCILTQSPIIQNHELIGAIYKIIFRQLDVWKDLLVRMEQLENELTYYRGELMKITGKDDPFAHIISLTPGMDKLKKEAYIAAQSFSTVLITGESGTGKELIAEGIHNASGRPGAFIKVNCAAIPQELLESEFFGYADGAFTGARKGGKPGKFELADLGTLFLDEIGDMPLQLQAKLLRVLQEKEFERIGDTKTTHVDVRIIAATNKDLWQLVQEGNFREDLFYRINVIHLHIPPLRDRLDDIPILCKHFIQKMNKKTKKTILDVTPEVIQLFQSFYWPGNIRQLENIIERAFHFCHASYIDVEHLPESFLSTIKLDSSPNITNHKTINPLKWNRQEQINDADKKIILEALEKANGNKTKAAEILGISRSTLYEKIKKYQIKEKSRFTSW
jgi:transcriptional regulator with PAS, ATPase and Fis domain